MGSDPLELPWRGGGEHNGPVGQVERRKQREPVVDQGLTVSDEELPAVGNDRAHPDQLVVVAAGHLKDREAPDPPSLVALIDRSSQQVVIERARTETHDDQARRSVFVTKGEGLEHQAST
jgi:hypothetical protein